MAFPWNWRLYHLLEIEPEATSRQIQWMFRKVTLRKHFHMAYLVLSDKERKILYGIAGEDGYEYIHSGAWGPLFSLLGTTWSVAVYCALLLIQLALLIIFFALLGARVDSVITINWMNVIAPLFAAVIILLIVAFIAMIVSFLSSVPKELGMKWFDRLTPLCNFLAAACYFIFPFVIATAINTDTTANIGSFEKYFCLLMMGDIFYYLGSLVWRWPRRIRAQMEVDNNNPSVILVYGFFLMAFAHMGVAIAGWILIGRRIDMSMRISWYKVFIPFCFRGGLRTIEAIMRSVSRKTVGVKSGIAVAFDSLSSFFVNSLLIISLYFVAVRIEEGQEKVRMARALIPVYIILAYIFIATIFSLVYMLRKSTSLHRAERLGNIRWTPPADKKDEAESDLGLPPTHAAGAQYKNWDEIDDQTSSGFPGEGLDDSEEEYEELGTDEEEELFPSEHSENAAENHSPFDEDSSTVNESRDGNPNARKPRVVAPEQSGSISTDEGEEEEEQEEDEEFEDEELESAFDDEENEDVEEEEDEEDDIETSESVYSVETVSSGAPRAFERKLTKPASGKERATPGSSVYSDPNRPLQTVDNTASRTYPNHYENEPFDNVVPEIRVIDHRFPPSGGRSPSEGLEMAAPASSSSAASQPMAQRR